MPGDDDKATTPPVPARIDIDMAEKAPLRGTQQVIIHKTDAEIREKEIAAEVEKTRIAASVEIAKIQAGATVEGQKIVAADHDGARNDRTTWVQALTSFAKVSFAGIAVILAIGVFGVLGFNAMQTGSAFNFSGFGFSGGVVTTTTTATSETTAGGTTTGSTTTTTTSGTVLETIPIEAVDTDADTDTL